MQRKLMSKHLKEAAEIHLQLIGTAFGVNAFEWLQFLSVYIQVFKTQYEDVKARLQLEEQEHLKTKQTVQRMASTIARLEEVVCELSGGRYQLTDEDEPLYAEVQQWEASQTAAYLDSESSLENNSRSARRRKRSSSELYEEVYISYSPISTHLTLWQVQDWEETLLESYIRSLRELQQNQYLFSLEY
jgi:hypothetical protein